MSELTQYYTEFASAGVWASPEKEECGCRGRGWFLSEVDTLHKCAYHYDGQPTNESSDEECEAYDAWVAAGRPPRAQVAPPPVAPLVEDDCPF